MPVNRMNENIVFIVMWQ